MEQYENMSRKIISSNRNEPEMLQLCMEKIKGTLFNRFDWIQHLFKLRSTI